MKALILVALIAVASPSPAPSPLPTLPISFPDFCRDHHSGAFLGTVTGPTLGVIILCRDADWKFYKSAVPQRVNHWPDPPPKGTQ